MTYAMKRLYAGIVALGAHACEGAFHESIDWQVLHSQAPARLLDLHLNTHGIAWPANILPGPPQGVQGHPIPNDAGICLLEDMVRGGKLVGAAALALARIQAGCADNLVVACRTRASVLHVYDQLTALLPGVPIVRGLPWDFLPDHSWYTRFTSRYLLAPVCVTTLEQIVNSMRLETNAYLRTVAIARAVTILDDVYTSDNRDLALARALIHAQQLVGGHTILTTAALDASARRQLLLDLNPDASITNHRHEQRSVNQPYSCVWYRPWDNPNPQYIRVRPTQPRPHDIVNIDFIQTSQETPNGMFVSMGRGEIDDLVARLAIEDYRRGAKVLVIRNTNMDAMNTSMFVEQLCPGALIRVNGQAVAYHRWYTPEDRCQVDFATRAAMGYSSSAEACIVVAGPQVENGLHLDADRIITDFAPFDSLLRRSGRMHAFPRPRPHGFESPRMTIVSPPLTFGFTFLEVVEHNTGRPRYLARGIGSVHKDMFDLNLTRYWLEQNGCIDRGQPRSAIETIYHPYNQAVLRRTPGGWAQHHTWLTGQLGAVDAAVGTLRWDVDPHLGFGMRSCDPRPTTPARHPEEAYLPDWPRRCYFSGVPSPLGSVMGVAVVKAWQEIQRGSPVPTVLGPNGSRLFGANRIYDNWGFRTLNAEEDDEQL